MAEITICSDFGAKEKVSHCFCFFPICHEVMGLDVISWFFEHWVLSQLFHSFTLIKRLFSSSPSAIRVLLSTYLRFSVFLSAILIPACDTSSPAFRMIYSACKLNKKGDNLQSWLTPFPIWNQPIVSCLVLTAASWLAYRFLRRQVWWSGIPIFLKNFPQFVVIHNKGFSLSWFCKFLSCLA